MKKIFRILIFILLFYTVEVNAKEYDVVIRTFNKNNYDKQQVIYLQKELRFVMGCELPTTGNFKSLTIECLNNFKRNYGITVDSNATVNSVVMGKLNDNYLANRVIVTSSKANVRSTTRIQNNNIIGSYKKGDIIVIYGKQVASGYTWYKIKYNNRDAYIASTTVNTNFVDIDIISQTLRLYKNSQLILDTPITTGKEDGRHDTTKGFFNVTVKQRNRTLQPSGAHVKYWVKFNNAKAIGIHDASWRTQNINYRYFGGTVYKNQNSEAGSRYTGSHGCVNIPVPKMKTIYDNVSASTASTPGTIVYVH